MYSRAQAAMEFLMTYGWAILIMLVVISVLFFLGVFSPQTTVSKSCVLPAGFSCYEFDMDSGGNIYLDIGQATGKTITVTGIGCAPSSPNATLNPNVQIPTGSHAIVTIGGTNCSGATNTAFKGKLLIQYTISGSSATRSVTGDVSAPLIGNSSTWGSGSYGGGTFLYRRQVTINTGVSSDLTDFPAYFILNTNSLISAGKMNSSCKDLRVLDSTMSTLLDYEIENGTCNNASTVVWFRIPQTRGNLTSVAYAFYGNNSTADAQNKAGVWKNSFVAVYHLGDLSDSTGVNTASYTNATLTAGRFGNALRFDGSTSYFDIPDSASLKVLNYLTVESWVNGTKGGIYNKPYAPNTAKTVYLSYYNTNKFHLEIMTHHSGYPHFYSNYVAPGLYHVAVVMKIGDTGTAQDVDYFLNGVNQTNLSAFQNNTYTQGTHLEYSTLNATLGSCTAYATPPPSEYYSGTIDETRISNTARSGDWLKAEYGQTYSVGSEVVN